MPDLEVHPTAIPGLLVLQLPLHGDARGWLKENWQRAKMTALGLPDFGPVQQTVGFNAAAGVTRGFHAEPWDKFVSVGSGRVFGAWVDLRSGPNFGATVTLELGPDRAVFVPRGVGNGYQTLEPGTVYSYLVNDHWSADATASYSYLNLADETAAIAWPIPLTQAQLSTADRAHPRLAEVVPMPPRRTLVVGASGQLGRALRALLPDALVLGRPELDVTDPASLERIDWRSVGTIINAGAYTAVDQAETETGRRDAWAVNVTGLARLVERARAHRLHFVQVSSDYVFDGTVAEHAEDEPPSPLGVYGQTKAAGDALVAGLPRHLIVRTSWVIGEGSNFVATMARLAAEGASPSVVSDQFGRLTFADDLAAAIVHLLAVDAPSGIYNVTNSGPVQSWWDIARTVFSLAGRDPDDVAPTTTADYAAGKLQAPRPPNSGLALDKLISTGFEPTPSADRLRQLMIEQAR